MTRQSCSIVLCYLFSLLSLVGIILILTAGLNRSSPVLDKLYFFQIDLRKWVALVSNGNSQSIGPQNDFYSIYLWNYCASDTPVSSVWSTCSKPKASFWFDITDAWNLTSTVRTDQDIFPVEMGHAYGAYHTGSRFIIAAYLLALLAKVGEAIIGLLTCCFQKGTPAVAGFVSLAATIFLLAGSATAIAIFILLVKAMNGQLESLGIWSTEGKGFLTLTWIAVGLSTISTIWWFLSAHRSKSQRSGPLTVSRDQRTWMPRAVIRNVYGYKNVTNDRHGRPRSVDPSTGGVGDNESLLHSNAGKTETSYEPYRHISGAELERRVP